LNSGDELVRTICTLNATDTQSGHHDLSGMGRECVSRKRVAIVTLGVMLSLFMASMEATVVSTAMPTIVRQLGGFEIYSWVFSAFMVASTTTVPIYGKLSDLYGRRTIYAIAMALFLVGSVLCGRATSMDQLVAFRAVQGLGAGGLMPLAFIIVSDLFTLEQRARIQGLFSGVWGVSSIAGPLLGGFLVDQVSWPWVFYINVLPGLLAAILVWVAWVDRAHAPGTAVSVDYFGAGLLSAGIVLLLLGLFALGTPLSWGLLTLAAALFALLLWVERRVIDPILPLRLFRERLFAVACAHGFFAGCALFGSAAFVPLFVQAVLGTSATAAGVTLTPQLIGWVVASIIGSRLLLRLSYRALAVTGMVLLVAGMFLMTQIGVNSSRLSLMFNLALTGVGMGLSIPAFLIAVQSSVQRHQLGTATSTVQFSRSIGGALGVSVLGVVLSQQLAGRLATAGLDPAAVTVERLLDPLAGAAAGAVADTVLVAALAGAISSIFVLACVAAALGLGATVLAPRGRIADLAARRAETETGNSPDVTSLPKSA
jgi:EmrB/QacA subfamily drug resistance transporter